jgi:acetoin utilization deacetylase AcuC-like enzyme
MLIMNASTDDAGHAEPGHPERPERLGAVMAGIDDLHLGDDLHLVAPRAATRSELVRVHDGSYLDAMGNYCYEGGGDIDADTYATYDSWSLAQYAAGAGLSVIREMASRNDGVGFVAVRPPGHHALRDRAMGFCLLNNVAVSAAELTSRGERVLILDWDVHHGNGTQAIFWDDPNVLYVSTHQWPLFPGSGAPYEVGGLAALDTTVNLPLPRGATGDVLQRALLETAAPVIDEFAPTWVLVSAGFDAHRDDPLAELALSSGDFAQLAQLAAGFTPSPGRLALFLEGGYQLDALRHCVSATLGALLGSDHVSERPTNGGPGADVVKSTREARLAALRLAHDTGA